MGQMTQSTMKNIVILVSGSGSNAQAIIDACANGQINGRVLAVISNVPGVYALERVALHNCSSPLQVDGITLNHKDFEKREDFDSALASKVASYSPDVVVLAGFMRILSERFVDQFTGMLFNIHPSLLPLYPGLHTHQKALYNNDKYHGCSIHFVSAELDGGPVVLQSRIKIADDDNEQSLAFRVAQREWLIYPLLISWFCDDRLHLQNDQVFFDNNKIGRQGLCYEDLTI